MEDAFPIVTIVDTLTVSEYADVVTLDIELSKTHDAPVDIDFAYVVTGSTATLGTDFNFTDEKITIIAGETKGSKTFSIKDDDDSPSVDEVFIIQATLTNGSFPTGTANRLSKPITVTITELPNVTIETDFTQVADSDYFEYTVTRAPTLNTALTVNLSADNFTLATDSNADVSSHYH